MTAAAEKTSRVAREFAKRLLEAANADGRFKALGGEPTLEIPRNPIKSAPAFAGAIAVPTALQIRTLMIWGAKIDDRVAAASVAASLMACADLIDALDTVDTRRGRYDLETR